jgi:RNA polymerase sigma factor (TIGR02999 family)
MDTPVPSRLTGLLEEWNRGSEDALPQLVPLVQAELRRIAAGYLRRERASHTLQPTALVNEAYIRLVGQRQVSWRSRAHFFALCAALMRRILVDHARRRGYQKRGGGALRRVTLSELPGVGGHRPLDLLALDEALAELDALDPRQREVVELRFFAGLSHEETAEALGVSLSTVERQWRLARAWLFRRLEGLGPSPGARAKG